MKKKSEHLVSVIIPAFNIQDYLAECLDSVLNQTYKNLQIIVINDGSTDNTGIICNEYSKIDERILIIHKQNQGVVAARGDGIYVSKGKYILFIDGDDWISSDMVEFMVENIEEHHLVSIGVEREIRKNYFVKRFDDYPEGVYKEKDIERILTTAIYDNKKKVLHRFTPWIVNKLFITDIIKEIYLNINNEMKYAEDTVTLYEYIKKCNSIVIRKKALYNYRYRESSAIHNSDKDAIKKITNTYEHLDNVLEFFPKKLNLKFQVQKWYIIVLLEAINRRMDFDEKTKINRFFADTDDLNLENKRIVLYAAGMVGQDYYRQFTDKNYNIVLWVDKNINKEMKMIHPLKCIHNVSYDIIIIAVEKEEVVDQIINELLELGVSEEKIIWRKPIYIY